MKKSNTIRGLKSFLILWVSQAVSSLGSAMTSYALIIWVYRQQGTATSVAYLSLFTYLPSILLCFVAGTLADKWDKKRIMLYSDLFAAAGTLTVFLLYTTGCLKVWHLYAVNFLISFMHAFQFPASYVAVTLLTPKDQYVRAGGLQALSGSLVTVLTPACATAVLAFGGLETVFAIDLLSFAVAFCTLLLFISIPAVPANAKEKKAPFLRSCLDGFVFLKAHRPVMKIILFFSFVNLIAYMTGFGILPAMILARTGDNQTTLGMVSTAIGIGTLAGSLLVTLLKPAGSKTRAIFLSCAISFLLCNIPWALGKSASVWILAAFVGNLPLPFLNANLTAVMRTQVPLEMQGRVFSTRDTLQFCTIPLGLFLGGYLADNVFEPLMMGVSPLQRVLSLLVGSGRGSGMAFMFLVTGAAGFFASLLSLKDSSYRKLDT